MTGDVLESLRALQRNGFPNGNKADVSAAFKAIEAAVGEIERLRSGEITEAMVAKAARAMRDEDPVVMDMLTAEELCDLARAALQAGKKET
jgi:hypothetical protein